MKATFAAKCRERWVEHQRSWDQLVGEDTDLENWERPMCMPDNLTFKTFHFALECAYAQAYQHAEAFLKRTVRNADRLETDDRFHDDEIADAGYPGAQAKVIRDRAYARWLLGDPLNHQDLRRASEMIIHWCLTKPDDHKRFQNPVTMNDYLEGVRMMMIVGDVEHGRELLNIKQTFRWHHAKEGDLWRRFLAAYPEIKDPLAVEFEAFFDRVRDPDFRELIGEVSTHVTRDWLRFETGIIRQMYVLNASLSDPVDPWEVIRAVAR